MESEGAADEAVLNNEHKNKKNPKKSPFKVWASRSNMGFKIKLWASRSRYGLQDQI
jgi:hypothetical protein